MTIKTAAEQVNEFVIAKQDLKSGLEANKVSIRLQSNGLNCSYPELTLKNDELIARCDAATTLDTLVEIALDSTVVTKALMDDLHNHGYAL